MPPRATSRGPAARVFGLRSGLAPSAASVAPAHGALPPGAAAASTLAFGRTLRPLAAAGRLAPRAPAPMSRRNASQLAGALGGALAGAL